MDRPPDEAQRPFGGAKWWLRDYSDDTARLVDEEVGRILDEQATRAREQLARSSDALRALATELLAHETLEADDIARLLSPTATATVAAAGPPRAVPDAPEPAPRGRLRSTV